MKQFSFSEIIDFKTGDEKLDTFSDITFKRAFMNGEITMEEWRQMEHMKSDI